MRQLESSSRIVQPRLFRDKDYRYKHNFHVAVSLNGNLCEFRSNFENISRDSRETFVRVSHDVPTNVAFIFIRTTVARHSECCTTFVRMSLKSQFYFLARYSRGVRMFAQDCRATVVRHSYECRENFALKIRQNFAATSSSFPSMTF